MMRLSHFIFFCSIMVINSVAMLMIKQTTWSLLPLQWVIGFISYVVGGFIIKWIHGQCYAVK